MASPINLFTLPLEIRLKIWQHALPPYAEADCCSDDSTSTRQRLFRNPWYPTEILPIFTYPSPRIPLRLINRQANLEITSHLPLPPLIGRTCDLMCLRRALSVMSSPSSTANALALNHLTAIRDVREVKMTPWPRNPSSGEETGDQILSESTEKIRMAVVKRLAASYVQQLGRFFHGARLAHSQFNEVAGMPCSAELEMLFEVGKPLRSVICGDGGNYKSVR